MKIFVVNCGSSSIKYQLIDMKDESVIAKGLVERIGIEGSVLTHTPAGKDKVRLESAIPTMLTASRRSWLRLLIPTMGSSNPWMKSMLWATGWCMAAKSSTNPL